MTGSTPLGAEGVQLPSPVELTRTMLRLKFRLYARSYTGISRVFLIAGLVIVAFCAALVVVGIFYLRNHPNSAELLAVCGGVVVLAWTLIPMIGGGERFLNPRPFSLLPVPLGNLLFAFLAASSIGIFASASAIVVLSFVTHASTIFELFSMSVLALVTWITMVLFGRVSVAISNTLQRRRRGREVATAITALAAISVALLAQSFLAILELVTPDRIATLRNISRWLPWGWAAETSALLSEGAYARALLWLVPSALLPIGLFVIWRRLMCTLLVVQTEQVKPTVSSSLLIKPVRSVKDTTLAAAFSRSVIQLRRDPREKIQLASTLPLVFITSLPLVDLLRTGDERIVLTSIAWGASTGFIAANLFGSDGPSVGVELLTGANSRSLIIGKALVRVAIVVPIILLFSIALAVITGGWQYVAVAVFMATSLSICSVGFGMQLSVRHPYPLPDNIGFTSSNLANGLLPGLLLFAAMAMSFIVTAPFIVPALFLSLFWSLWIGTFVAFVGLLWSAVLFLWSARKAASWLDNHHPEFFAALSRPSS